MPVVFQLADNGTSFKHLAIRYRRRIGGTDPIYLKPRPQFNQPTPASA